VSSAIRARIKCRIRYQIPNLKERIGVLIIAAIVVVALALTIIMFRTNRASKRPEYLRGKKADRYTDLITNRDVYIACTRDPKTKKLINEAYFVEDGATCERALYRQIYGFLYFSEGVIRVIPKRIALQYLQAATEGKNPDINFHRHIEEEDPSDG